MHNTMTRLTIPRRPILHLVLTAALGGCAWPTPPQRPAEPAAPAAWQGADAAAAAAPVSSPETPWWQALRDPQLDALQTQALQTNIDTLRKAMSWQAALTRARLTSLDEQPRPSFSLNANTARTLHSGAPSVVVDGVSVPVSSAASTTHNFGSNASVSYEVDLWSKLASATQGDRAEAAIRREDLRSARWLVSAKVAEAYWTIAAIDAKLPLLTELAQAADEALHIARLRLKEGKLRADEVDAVVTRQYEARKSLADARADRRLRLYELSLLLDRAPPALAPGDARLPPGEPAEPALGTPAQTLARRPDVRQARLAVDAALARLHVAEASRYPALSLSLNLSTNGANWGHWFSQPLATLGQSLMIPMVDWRRLDAQRDIARDTLDDAALGLRASVRQALVDVENALLERERWRQAWEAARAQQDEKDKLYAVARLRREVGVFGRLDVLQSREGVLRAQMDVIDLRLKAWLDLLNLYKALGGAV
jgi:NodT family efflux transporter outer membrane factor (OMF) lipoprotein